MFRHAVISTVGRTASSQLRALSSPVLKIAVTAATRQASIRSLPRFYSDAAAPDAAAKKEEAAPKAEDTPASEIQKKVEELKTQLDAKAKEVADFKV